MQTRKRNRALATGILLLLLFVVFTALVSQVDVQGIGPNGSLVGMAHINGPVRDLVGTSDFFYKISEILGYLSLLVAVLFCLCGLIQWITRRSLFKVDRELIYMYIFYVIVVLAYILFEFFIVNYRPVLEDGELAASYPSSHTVLVVSVFGMAIAGHFGSIFGSRSLRRIACWISGLLIVAMVACRLLAGVHWLTDIVGGLLLAGAVLSLYTACLRRRRRTLPAVKTEDAGDRIKPEQE